MINCDTFEHDSTYLLGSSAGENLQPRQPTQTHLVPSHPNERDEAHYLESLEGMSWVLCLAPEISKPSWPSWYVGFEGVPCRREGLTT